MTNRLVWEEAGLTSWRNAMALHPFKRRTPVYVGVPALVP